MRKLLIILVLFSILFGIDSIAQELPEPPPKPDYTVNTENCTIYYLRKEIDWQNVAMLCDGEIVFIHKVLPETQMYNSNRFKFELKRIFLLAVNKDNSKTCSEGQNAKRWWVTCKRLN